LLDDATAQSSREKQQVACRRRDAWAGNPGTLYRYPPETLGALPPEAGNLYSVPGFLDVNGDGKVDYQMKINGDVTGDSGGWLL